MLILILILGVFLRLINLDQSLWLDEAISTLAARDYSYYAITFDFLKIDNHPPLFYLLLKLWGEVLGFTDWVLRMLPVTLGSVLIFISYKLTYKISKEKNLAIIVSLLISSSPLLVYFSQEVRMYMLITLLAMIQIYIFSCTLEKPKWWKWLAFSCTNCLLFFSDYITVFLFPVFLIYPLIRKDGKLLTKIIISFIPLGLLFSLWFPMFNDQLLKNREIVNSFPGWQFIVGGATLKNLAVIWMKFVLGRISFEPKLIYYSLVLLATAPVLISLFLAAKTFKKHLLVWLWLIIPILLGFAFSWIIPVFNYFRFIYVLPALLILVAIGINSLRSQTLQRILITLVLLTNLTGLLIYYLDPAQSRENWRQAVSYIENQAGPNDLVVFEFLEPVAPYRWYSNNQVEVIGAIDSYSSDRQKTHEKLDKVLFDKTKIYHFEYLRDLTDPEKFVEQKLEMDGFRKGEVLSDFKNIGQLSIWNRVGQ